MGMNKERLKKILKKEYKKNEEIIFKWDGERIENLLENVFQKVGM